MAHAIVYRTNGGPEVLEYVEIEDATPGEGQIVVAVRAAGVNPIDSKLRSGMRPAPTDGSFRRIGSDAAGVVTAVGDSVEGYAVGDEVIVVGAIGAYSTEISAKAGPKTFPKPAGLDWARAAALGIPTGTAYQAVASLGVAEGDTLLLHGGAGAVGQAAIQFAVRAGATVIATASPRSRDAVRSAGADQIIDHTSSDVLGSVTEPVDVLLNLAPLSPDEFASLVDLVRDGGVVVSTTAWMPTPSDEKRGVRAVGVFVRADRENLQRLVSLVDSGELTVEVSRLVSLSELPAIHAQAAAGELRGKVVAVPDVD